MDVDMSEMKYVNADGSEMNREELIAIIEKIGEENERKAQRICDLLNDKRDAYVKACKADWNIANRAKLYAALPEELRDDEAANDILEIDGAIEVMAYICNCIHERVPTVSMFDSGDSYRWNDRFTRDECRIMHIISDCTFEDACMMFSTLSLDDLLNKGVIDLDVRESSFHRMVFNGLKLQWKMIKEQLDGTAGLRALLE